MQVYSRMNSLQKMSACRRRPKNRYFLMRVLITQFAIHFRYSFYEVYSDPFHAIESFGSLVTFGFKKRIQNAGTSTSDRDIKLTPLNYNNNTRRVKSNWFWTCAHHLVQRKGRGFIEWVYKGKKKIHPKVLQV